MHGEIPKQLLAKARGNTRRTLAIAVVLIAVVAALYYVFGGPARTAAGAAAVSAPRGRYPFLSRR